MKKYTLDTKQIKRSGIRFRIWNNETGGLHEQKVVTIKKAEEIGTAVHVWVEKVIQLNKEI